MSRHFRQSRIYCSLLSLLTSFSESGSIFFFADVTLLKEDEVTSFASVPFSFRESRPICFRPVTVVQKFRSYLCSRCCVMLQRLRSHLLSACSDMLKGLISHLRSPCSALLQRLSFHLFSLCSDILKAHVPSSSPPYNPPSFSDSGFIFIFDHIPLFKEVLVPTPFLKFRHFREAQVSIFFFRHVLLFKEVQVLSPFLMFRYVIEFHLFCHVPSF